MRSIAIPLFILGYYMALVSCDGYNKEFSGRINDLVSSDGVSDSSSAGENDFIDKRAERYGFGLGRRAYTYTSNGQGVKRLPVYNFGLGKRAGKQYNFGLGKRRYDDDDDDYMDNQDTANLFDAGLMRMLIQPNEKYNAEEKRARPYSFGLGKRYSAEGPSKKQSNDNIQRYNFGLGKR